MLPTSFSQQETPEGWRVIGYNEEAEISSALFPTAAAASEYIETVTELYWGGPLEKLYERPFAGNEEHVAMIWSVQRRTRTGKIFVFEQYEDADDLDCNSEVTSLQDGIDFIKTWFEMEGVE